MRALVTGAQGFVGRYLIAELLASQSDVRIVGVGRSAACTTFTHTVTWRSMRVAAPLPPELRSAAHDARYAYQPVDIRDRARFGRILREFSPDVVFHLASGLRDDAPHHLFGTNVEGTIDVLESVAAAGLAPRAIVIGSSGSVYGLPACLPIAEGSPCEPRDFYAVSKLAQEHAARIVARERDLPIVIARIFNIVGPGQDERHVAGRFAAQIAAVIAGTSEARMLVGDLSPTRDFIDVRDVARALALLARSGAPGSIYNVASGLETPISQILELLIDAADLRGALDPEAKYLRLSDTPRVVADVARLHDAGHRDVVTLGRSLHDVLAYYTAVITSAASAATSLHAVSQGC